MSSPNGYSVDRSAALAELQSNYGMSSTHPGFRVPTFSSAKPKSAPAPAPAPSPAARSYPEDDGASFMTTSASSSSSLSSSASSVASASSLKAKAAALFRFGSSSSSSSTAVHQKTLPTAPSSPADGTTKPHPELVFALLSSQYGIGTPGAGFKLPKLESSSKKSNTKTKTKTGSQKSPELDTASPEVVLASLMDQYGAPGRSQVRLYS
ncbi:hypothetical protein OC842_003405 [Tilletia horrida]|uniref:Uncharacterized protein n=1 Tax=Tilletia horrida TaxID=155126 RepID=A0AAN6GB97_9BASI|nr:hypothetical protein OC842_003405 [Tilletia horrida]